MNVLSTVAHQFLTRGVKPTSERERNALLDELKSAVSSTVQGWTPPTTPAELDKLERASKALKEQRERQLKATEEAFAKQREQRLAIEKRLAAKPATKPAATSKPAATTPPRPYADYSTETLRGIVRIDSYTEAAKKYAIAELAHRGINVYPKKNGVGFISIESRK